MKKTIFSVAMAFAAGLFVSCTASAPKVDLAGASKVDSLAYAVGVSQTEGLKDYLAGRMDVDTTHMNAFVNGPASAKRSRTVFKASKLEGSGRELNSGAALVTAYFTPNCAASCH